MQATGSAPGAHPQVVQGGAIGEGRFGPPAEERLDHHDTRSAATPTGRSTRVAKYRNSDNRSTAGPAGSS